MDSRRRSPAHEVQGQLAAALEVLLDEEEFDVDEDDDVDELEPESELDEDDESEEELVDDELLPDAARLSVR